MPTQYKLEIEKRAHDIWLTEGCPERRDFDHWLQAEKEILDNHTKPKGAAPKRKASAPKQVNKIQ